MKLNTASEAVSFSTELENESAEFYQDLAQRYAEDKDTFLSFAKENGRNVVQVQRAYYGVITDAIEGCYSFGGIDTDNYCIETTLSQGKSYSDALNMAIALEEKITKYYLDAAEVSKSLMADVPQAFGRIAKKRNERVFKLKSLLGEG